MNRYVVLYLATLIVLVPVDFLFLGIVAKGFFTSEVGDMLGEIRLAPAILFYLLLCGGRLILVSGSAAATSQSTLLVRCVVRIVLLCDLRSDVAGAAQALELAGRHRRRGLGIVRDRSIIDRGLADRQLACTEGLTPVIPGLVQAHHPGMTASSALLRPQ